MNTSSFSVLARRKRHRGNALIEFAIGFGLLLSCFAGVFQFGYAFYVYNMLESAVRDGARYGSLTDYDAYTGANMKQRVRQMVVYGNPFATSGTPVVRRLSTSNVVVDTVNDVKGVPTRVNVRISGFTINTFFAQYTLNGKPACNFDYAGRFTVP